MIDESRNPWTTKSSLQRFENSWIRILDHEVIHPNGAAGNYTFVQFRKRAVAILPLDAERNTWLVGQYRYTLGEYSWEIPEGGCEEGEELIDCAKRELREETGLAANHFELVLEMRLSNSVTDEKSFSFLATEVFSAGQPTPDPSEELQIRKVSWDQCLDLVMTGVIKDALSVATILKVDRMLRDGFSQRAC